MEYLQVDKKKQGILKWIVSAMGTLRAMTIKLYNKGWSKKYPFLKSIIC